MKLTHPLVTRLAVLALIFATSYKTTVGAPVTYFGIDDPKGALPNSMQARNNFVATLGSYGTDNIESYASFTPDPTLTFGGTGLTAQTDVAFVATFAVLAVSGSNALLDQGPPSSTDPSVPDVFTLSAPVTAFGSFFSNAGDGASNTVTLVLENTILGTSKNVVVGTFGPGAGFDNVFYFGVTDTDPFNRVTMLESFDFDGILLDDITAGFVSPVPEPSTIALVVGACFALLLFRPLVKYRAASTHTGGSA